VFRKAEEPTTPAQSKSPQGTRLAIWQTDLFGTRWLDDLKDKGDARFLAFNGGYPLEYTAQAKHLLPPILADIGPPLANAVWKMDLEDFLAGAAPSPIGRTGIDHDVAAQCAPAEWLIVEAWDAS
jgi:hypothetical protein